LTARSFIRDVETNSDAALIATAVISLAKTLNLKVIAEGVETDGQLAFLRARECGEMQGDDFSRPLEVNEVADLLRIAGVSALSAAASL
jgi:EAL domain-containing protein (putative c-di-GMP-specific phosphodiesterase class I)